MEMQSFRDQFLIKKIKSSLTNGLSDFQQYNQLCRDYQAYWMGTACTELTILKSGVWKP
jgi:hypothetical protein